MEHEIDLSFIILKGLTLLKKYLFLIIISVLLCAGISLARFYTKVPVYQSSMLISTGIVKSPIAASLLEEVQELIGEQNVSEISKRLDLGKAANKIKKIEVEKVEGKADNGQVDIVKIIVKTTETKILSALEKSLVQYLESNPYVQKRVSFKKEQIKNEIVFLNQELDDVSALKSNIFKNSSEGNISKSSFDLEDIYRQSKELFERKLQLTHDLKTIENFQVIQGFTAFQKPVSPKLSLSLAGGVLAGLILAFLFIFLKEFGKHLKTLGEQSE